MLEIIAFEFDGSWPFYISQSITFSSQLQIRLILHVWKQNILKKNSKFHTYTVKTPHAIYRQTFNPKL